MENIYGRDEQQRWRFSALQDFGFKEGLPFTTYRKAVNAQKEVNIMLSTRIEAVLQVCSEAAPEEQSNVQSLLSPAFNAQEDI